MRRTLLLASLAAFACGPTGSGNGTDTDVVAGDDLDQDGYTAAIDCDDNDPSVHPYATEVAGNDVDEDCDNKAPASASDLDKGDLIVSELLNKPAAVDQAYGEWIELHNTTDKLVDLGGLDVSLESGAAFTVDDGVTVEPGGYVVLAREGDLDLNGGIASDFDYRSDFALDDDRDTLTLSVGDKELDVVAFDQDAFFPDIDGAAMSLDFDHQDADANDDGQRWCPATDASESGDLGTPGAANPACDGMEDDDNDQYVAAHDCADTNAAIHPGATEAPRDNIDQDCDGADTLSGDLRVGDLVITEIMVNPDLVGDKDGEWFEVVQKGTSAINLNGLGIGDETGALFTVDADLILAPNQRLVFAAKSDPLANGGVDNVGWDYPASSLGLSNSGGTLALLKGLTAIDRVVWNTTTFPTLAGASLTLDPTTTTAAANDIAGNWCSATTHIGRVPANDRGTPGAANDACN